MEDAIDPQRGIVHPDFKDAFALMNAEVHELVQSVQVRLARRSPAAPACLRAPCTRPAR